MMSNLPSEGFLTENVLSSSYFITSVGAPLLIGIAVGYFVKKILRVTLLVAGASLVVLFFTEFLGIIQINDLYLQQTAQTTAELANQGGDFLFERLTRITSKGVSASVGFFMGLRMG